MKEEATGKHGNGEDQKYGWGIQNVCYLDLFMVLLFIICSIYALSQYSLFLHFLCQTSGRAMSPCMWGLKVLEMVCYQRQRHSTGCFFCALRGHCMILLARLKGSPGLLGSTEVGGICKTSSRTLICHNTTSQNTERKAQGWKFSGRLQTVQNVQFS